MRVLLSTYDSRGGVEPLVALAVRLRELGAEALMCAPPDCAERLAEVGVPHLPIGASVRALVHGETPPDVPRIIDELVTAQFELLAKAGADCDAIVLTGLMPAVLAGQSVAELLGLPTARVSYCPLYLPSPHHRPQPLPGRSVPPEVTDLAELDALDVANYNAVFGSAINAHRAAAGLPPVDDVRYLAVGDQPWLAADPVLAPWREHPGLDVVQTGTWFLHDERPLPADLLDFLDAGEPPVYAGFGSMRPPGDFARVAVAAIRAQGRRVVVGRGWADLELIDDRDDCFAVGEVNQRALFGRVAAVIHHGGAGTTATAARAGAPQVVVPQIGDQPYWAGRVAALGVGAAHPGPTPTAESLAAALGAALDPSVRERARAVAGSLRADGAAVAARRLLELAC